MTQPMPGNEDVSRFPDAYEKIREELKRVAPSDYALINLDIPTSVTTVLGALPAIKAMRAQIVDELPKFDAARFDKLETYTLALGHAHANYQAASRPAESLDALGEEGAKLRDLLVADATALAHRGHIDREQLRTLKGVRGYRNLGFDLLTLATLFRGSWKAIQGRCGIQESEVKRAEILGDRILTAVGHREQAPATVVEAAEMRQRAFTLFIGAYEHVQRAIRYVRSEEGDADEIAPSIYGASRSRRYPSGQRRRDGQRHPSSRAAAHAPGSSSSMALAG